MAAHQSSNEHEAERALVQLDALLSRYRINLTELHKGHVPKIVQKYAPLTRVDRRWTLSPSLPSEREGELVQKSEGRGRLELRGEVRPAAKQISIILI